MGGKRIGGLKARVGRECSISKEARWVRLNSGGIPAGGVRRGSHSAGSYGISKKSKDAAERAALTPGAALSTASLLFLEIPYLPALF